MIKVQFGEVLENRANTEMAVFHCKIVEEESTNQWGELKIVSQKETEDRVKYAAVLVSTFNKTSSVQGEYFRSEQFKDDLKMFFQKVNLELIYQTD
jgi:hypothetical protein